MHKKLEDILSKVIEELLKKKQNDNSFYKAMQRFANGKVAIIAEVKFASPTEVNLGSPDELLIRIKEYEKGGADAISVVTEKHFFNGDPLFVGKIKQAVSLPILQKDFVIDEYQIYEEKLAGSDAILFIARILSKEDLIHFVKKAQEIGLEPVVEINSEDDLKKAVQTETEIIAVNARDLDTFEVDVDKACSILRMIPDNYTKLGFSGIKGRKEAEKYQKAGANGILIGTSLMKSKNIKEFIEGIKI